MPSLFLKLSLSTLLVLNSGSSGSAGVELPVNFSWSLVPLTEKVTAMAFPLGLQQHLEVVEQYPVQEGNRI